MKVKELIKMLEKENPNREINIASDEEGNSYGDISTEMAEGKLLKGGIGLTLYPENCQMAEELYDF